jgi:hypothetical protein
VSFVHDGGSRGEADRQHLLAGGDPQTESDVAFVGAGVAERDINASARSGALQR